MKKENCLTINFVSDFAGTGFLRTHYPIDHLNSVFGQPKVFEGIVTSRIILEQRLLPQIKNIRFQRQITNDQLQLIKMVKALKENGKFNFPIIYDHDDLLTQVPDYNAASRFYNQPFIESNLREIVNLVDIFTVTTYDLKKEIEKFGGRCKVKIVPNYIPKYLYRPYDFIKKENKKPKIIWAGSSTHFSNHNPGDLGIVLDLIKNTVNEFDWVFFGIKDIPIWFNDIKDKITILPWLRNIQSFPLTLKMVNADFGIAPLLNNTFNKCKSSIKFCDYASSDIIAITSNLPPY